MDTPLAGSSGERRAGFDALVADAEKFDVARAEELHPFPAEGNAAEIGAARAALGQRLAAFFQHDGAAGRARHFAARSDRDVFNVQTALTVLNPEIVKIRAERLDAELLDIESRSPLQLTEVLHSIATLDEYLADSGKWYASLRFANKAEAAEALKPYGLRLSPQNAERLRKFLEGVQTRLIVENFQRTTLSSSALEPSLDDAALLNALDDYAEYFELRKHIASTPALVAIAPDFRAAVEDLSKAPALIRGLAHAKARGTAIAAMESALEKSGLLPAEQLSAARAAARRNEALAPVLAKMRGD